MSKTNIAVVPTNGVEGNITSCGIETAEISIDRANVWSLAQYKHYQSYNVCTGEVVNRYMVPEATGFSLFIGLLIPFVILALLTMLSS